MTKIKNKATGELCDVDSTYADRIKQKVTIYLKHGNGKIDTIPLETLMKEYEVAPELSTVSTTKTVDDLEEGDECWLISGSLVMRSEWTGSPGQLERRAVGDIVLTKEEAEKRLEWRRAKEVLERDTKGFKPSEENDRESSQVYWDGEKLDVVYNYGIDGSPTFSSHEDAETSIKAHPKEWKIYLGVEE